VGGLWGCGGGLESWGGDGGGGGVAKGVPVKRGGVDELSN